MPESVDRELDKCDYLHQAQEALHHLSTEMNEEMQLKRRFVDSTPAFRQKQYNEGVKRITQLKGSFLHLTNEQQVKILVAMSSVPQINATPTPTAPAPIAPTAPIAPAAPTPATPSPTASSAPSPTLTASPAPTASTAPTAPTAPTPIAPTPIAPTAPIPATPTPTASSAPAPTSAIASSAPSGPGAVPGPASSAIPTTPSASAIANDVTGGESARDTISMTIADALADDDMWV